VIKHICNGCHREVNQNSVDETNSEIYSWFEKNREMYAIASVTQTSGVNFSTITQTYGVNDAFCPACLPLAHAYWDAKAKRLIELDRHVTSTLKKHCKRFFQKTVERKHEDQAVSRPN